MNGADGDKFGKDDLGYSRAVGDPPKGLMAGFAEGVFTRTTKVERHPAARERRLLVGMLGAASAAAAGIMLWPRAQRPDGEVLELAELDLELLENLELCSDLELLELLEAVEEIENG